VTLINYKLPDTPYPTAAGFSFIELIAVIAIMAFCAAMLAGPLQDRSDQGRIARTLTLMEEIETALLGRELPGEPGTRTVGYIPDVGGLPPLVNGQPRGLWSADTDGDGTDDLLRLCQFMDDGHVFMNNYASNHSPLYVWKGWRGPYLGTPRDGVLRDGWGNALVFQPDIPGEGDLTILSPGANGVVSDQDSGADSNLARVIRKSRYTAPVAGVILPNGINALNSATDVGIRIYYAAPAPDKAHTHVTDLVFLEPEMQTQTALVAPDGYFLFRDVPAGTERLLEISQPLPNDCDKKVLTYFTIEVLPTVNWLGRLDIRNAYDSY
jgi:prepilin-type N-terminal cleavage/methylation domain-containing protein